MSVAIPPQHCAPNDRSNKRNLVRSALLLASLAMLCIAPTACLAIAYPDGTMDARKAGWAVPMLITTGGGTGVAYGTCTGSILDKYTIVTAAHCVEGFTVEQLYAGTMPGSAKGSYFQCGALAAETHPRYTAGNVASADDVAVISLNPACVDANAGTPQVNPLKLASASTPLTAPLVLYGWGVNQNGKDPNRLQFLHVQNYSPLGSQFYGNSYKPAMHIAAGHIFGNEGVFGSACNGDSGGPLVHWAGKQPYLVGITSFGVSGCRVKAPTVFTRVSAVRGWITHASATTAGDSKSALLNFGFTKKVCTTTYDVICKKANAYANIAIDKSQLIINFDFPWTSAVDLDLNEDGKVDLHADDTGIHRLDGSTPPECAIVDTSVGWVYNTSCLRLPGVIETPVFEINATLHGVVNVEDDLGNVCGDSFVTCDRNFAFDIKYVTVPSA